MVSRSSAEAEYQSMATTDCQLSWLKNILNDLSVTHARAALLFWIIKPNTYSRNPLFRERTKYIEIDRHFIRNMEQVGE